MIDKTLLERYATLKKDEKRIAEELELLSPEIKEMMAREDADKIETSFGNFTLGEQTRWKFSKAVEDLQEKEKANGTAQRVTSTVLRYTAPKQKDAN